MRVIDTLDMAMSAIARNKIRSVLTALGIVIGVASVIAMVHLGQAATVSVTERISQMGSNLLIIRPGSEQRGRGGTRSAAAAFTTQDVDAIAREIDGVQVAPTNGAKATLVYGNQNHGTSITGTTNEYLTTRNREIATGRAIGARAHEVLTQFLVEAITLSTLGGLLGVGLGVVGTYMATEKLGLPLVLSPETMLLGFSVSVIIGVVFGYVPARKAAHLNPIEALRHE